MQIKVSVVTPVYNPGAYLFKCLDSLAAQTLDGLEFICIDDGSTDDSAAVLDSYARGDSRFKVIHQENVGYGVSMNRGISLAQGEYVAFLDPDDYIESNAYEVLYATSAAYGRPEIIKANHYRFSESGGDRFNECYSVDMCQEKFSLLDDGKARVMFSPPAIWAALYRRDFLRDNEIKLTEVPGVCYQDTSFVNEAWIACRSCVLVHDAFVHYRIDNPNSSTKAPGNVTRICEEYDLSEAYLARFEDGDVLAPYIAVRRFGTYEWNLKRLQDVEREEFILFASPDIARLLEEGVLGAPLLNEDRLERARLFAYRPLEYYARYTYDPTIRSLHSEIASLRMELDEEQKRSSELREQLREQQGRMRAVKSRLQVLEKELSKVKASKSYNLGRAFTYVPRKAKSLLNRVTRS